MWLLRWTNHILGRLSRFFVPILFTWRHPFCRLNGRRFERQIFNLTCCACHLSRYRTNWFNLTLFQLPIFLFLSDWLNNLFLVNTVNINLVRSGLILICSREFFSSIPFVRFHVMRFATVANLTHFWGTKTGAVVSLIWLINKGIVGRWYRATHCAMFLNPYVINALVNRSCINHALSISRFVLRLWGLELDICWNLMFFLDIHFFLIACSIFEWHLNFFTRSRIYL
jgi:hypothetical protein